MSGKTHWKKLHNPDYLGAYALEPGEDLIATIGKVQRETVTGPDGKKEDCTVVHFSQPKDTKPMILNATNAKTIERIYKTPYIEEWAGRSIQIFVERVKAFGDYVDALRIRPKEPKRELPELTPDHPKWSGAVDSLQNKSIDIAGVKKHFIVSTENEQLLIEQAGIAG